MKHILLIFLLSLSTFAQITNVNVGTAANDNTGDTLRVAFQRLNTSIAYLDTNKATAFSTGTGVTNVSAVLSANITAGSNITFTTNSNGAIAIAAASGSSVSVNGAAVSSPNLTNSATLTFSVSGSNVSSHPTNLTAAQLSTDSVSADELNATGVESELEAVLDLQDMQGAITDAQVPNNITIDLATTATTANSGDSATAFFSSGEIEDARLPAAITRDTEWDTIAEIETATGANIITVGELDGTANWTAEGTTNSTLAGEARVHNLVATNAVTVGASGTLGWSDVLLNRGGANILEQRNGTSAQTFNLYNTYTDASNYERFGMRYNSGAGAFDIGTQMAGTGSARSVAIQSANTILFRVNNSGTSAWLFSAAGHLLANTDNTYDIGASGATRPRTVYAGTSAIAPIYKAANGSGTDAAGTSVSLQGGQSTGTGRGGAIILQTSPSGATGSSANAYSTRTYKSAKAVALTETTATTIANITCAASKYIGGTAIITVFASDATDHQARTLRLSFSAVNKAGTVTAAIDTPNESVAVSAGTLTATITAVANGNSVDLKVDATSSLTQTTLEASWALEINGSDVATVTAQ